MQILINRPAIALCFGLSVPTPAVADITTDIGLTISEQFGTTITTTFNENNQESSVAATINDAINGPQNSSISPSSAVQASPGSLRAEVNAEANIPGVDILTSVGNVLATWSARPTINIDGVAPGVAGTATAAMGFSGGLSFQNNGFSTNNFYSGSGLVSLELDVANQSDSDKYEAFYRHQETDPNNRLFRITVTRPDAQVPVFFPVNDTNPGTAESYIWNQTVDVSFDFITGQPFDLLARLTVNGNAAVQNSGRLNWFSSVNEADWEGLLDVTIGGQTVTDFTAIDEFTGLDLADAVVAPIPVPAAVWFFGSGLLALIGVARRN